MFLDTNEKLQPEFKSEPEPIKEVKKIDAETLKKNQNFRNGKKPRGVRC